jgi:hypothetical protein
VLRAALPDGTVHAFAVGPGSGVYERSRTAAGAWATSSTRIDANGNTNAMSDRQPR